MGRIFPLLTSIKKAWKRREHMEFDGRKADTASHRMAERKRIGSKALALPGKRGTVNDG